jgi:hypothetical protein
LFTNRAQDTVTQVSEIPRPYHANSTTDAFFCFFFFLFFPPPLKPNQNQAKYQHHPTIRTSKITNTSYSIQQQIKDRIFFSLKPNQYFQTIISERERELPEVETEPVERSVNMEKHYNHKNISSTERERERERESQSTFVFSVAGDRTPVKDGGGWPTAERDKPPRGTWTTGTGASERERERGCGRRFPTDGAGRSGQREREGLRFPTGGGGELR